MILTPVLALSEIEDEIEVTPPPNWKPSNSIDTSASMIWFQNSTKSVFAIVKAPNNLVAPLFLAGAFDLLLKI